MRRAEEHEIHTIADFLVDRFYNLEQFSFFSNGLNDPKSVLKSISASELYLYFSYGDIYICGESEISGVLVGIPSNQYSMFHILTNSFKTRKNFKNITKQDIRALKVKMKAQDCIHNRKWFKKYSKQCYYITQFAISKKDKGTGAFRKMLMPIIDDCKQKNIDIVLETFTKANVPIYEHFGFALVEIHSHESIPFSEYCMIYKLNKL